MYSQKKKKRSEFKKKKNKSAVRFRFLSLPAFQDDEIKFDLGNTKTVSLKIIIHCYGYVIRSGFLMCDYQCFAFFKVLNINVRKSVGA